MFRNKNKLMSAGRVEEANALAIKVKDAITKANAVKLKNIDVRHGLKDLWDKVNKLTKRRTSPSSTVTVTALDLNAHYANISSDPHYPPPWSSILLQATSKSPANTVFFKYSIACIIQPRDWTICRPGI